MNLCHADLLYSIQNDFSAHSMLHAINHDGNWDEWLQQEAIKKELCGSSPQSELFSTNCSANSAVYP